METRLRLDRIAYFYGGAWKCTDARRWWAVATMACGGTTMSLDASCQPVMGCTRLLADKPQAQLLRGGKRKRKNVPGTDIPNDIDDAAA